MFRGPRLYGWLTMAFCLPAVAHHSLQATFDTGRQIEIAGVVAEYTFVNPHARIVVDAETDDGRVERWVAEGGAVQVLRRKGWTGDEFRPGDRVVIDGNPAKDGSRLLSILTIGLPDGRDLTLEDIDFEGIDELRRARR